MLCESLENIKVTAKQSLGLYELKQHKPWFHEEYLKLSIQRKQDKMQFVMGFLSLDSPHILVRNDCRNGDPRFRSLPLTSLQSFLLT